MSTLGIVLVLSAPFLLWRSFNSRPFTLLLLICFIYFGPFIQELFQLSNTVTVTKIAGLVLFFPHILKMLMKKESISLRNNHFLFLFTAFFILSAYINDTVFFSYWHQLLFFGIGTYIIVRYLLKDIQEVEKFMTGLVYLGAGIVITGLFFGLHRLEFEQEILVDVADPNNLGLMIASILPILFFLLLKKQKTYQRFIYIIIMVLFLVALIWSASRGAIVGFLAGIFILLLFKKRDKKRLVVLAFSLLILSALLIPDKALNYAKMHYMNLTPGSQDSIKSRIAVLKKSRKILKDNIIFGVGPGNFEKEFFRHTGTVRSPHNVYLQVLAETGIIAFCFFSLTIYYAFKGLKGAYMAYRESNDYETQDLILTIGICITVFAVGSVFLNNLYSKMWYILFGMAQAVSYMTLNKIKFKKNV